MKRDFFCLSLVLLCLVQSRAAQDARLPDFKWPVRGSGRELALTDLKGSVVVLDFFAHWCVPCVRASAEIETGIRQYYEARGAKSNHVPVRVFGVNVEAAQPELTDAFIARAGMTEVLDDFGGAVFQQLGGSGMPLIVIIDATGPGPARLVYRKSGFEGVEVLREEIDRIGANGAGAEGATTRSGPRAGQTVDPAANDRATLDFGTMLASDIRLTDTSLEYRRAMARGELGLTATHGYMGLDYVPESPIERSTEVSDHRFGAQGRARFIAHDRLSLTANAGGYSGYMDYRSFWLNEHFRQLFGQRPGYRKAEPWGVNVSGGARWEYLPASGFIQGDLSYQHDIISPGYAVQLTFPPTLVRYRDEYDTLSGKLTLENVLTPRIRTQQELQIMDTTDRELRYSGQTSLNWAAAEHWVARFALAGTVEAPEFESWSAFVNLERDWRNTWFVGAFGRYYEDTGQIENALLADNTAAPPLHALHAGLGARWQSPSAAVKLAVGPYFSRYDKPGPGTSTFGKLYADRDWLSVQFALMLQF